MAAVSGLRVRAAELSGMLDAAAATDPHKGYVQLQVGRCGCAVAVAVLCCGCAMLCCALVCRLCCVGLH